MPVFHVLEDFSWLERYLERYFYIGLGVAGMQQRAGVMPWLVKCFKTAGTKAVFHGFGLTSWEVMRTLPWFSIDSSSWGSGFRYGRVPIFNPDGSGFLMLRLGSVSQWQKHAALIRSMGFDWVDFAYRDRNERTKIGALSALSYIKAEQWLRRSHGEIFRPGNGPPGISIYQADANPTRFVETNSGLRLHLSDTSNGINYADAAPGLKLFLSDTARIKDIVSVQASPQFDG